MNWPQSLVVVWMQFALGAMAILGVTRLALSWVIQPVERIRLIQSMVAAILVLPLLYALSPLPSQSLGLVSFRLADPLIDSNEVHRRPVVEVVTEPPVDSTQGEFANTQSGQEEKEADSQYAMAFPGISPVNSDVLAAGASSVSRTTASLASNRYSTLDRWFAVACVILFAHTFALLHYVIEQVLGQIRLKRLCGRAARAPESVDLAWNAIADRSGERVHLLVSDDIKVPLMFGWRRPTIVIPSDICETGGLELKACLAHEWSHIENGDIPVWRLVNLCQIFFWYQPSFWFLRRELRICQEVLADHRSVNDVIAPLEYSELLMQFAKRRTMSFTGALTMFDQPSQLARRVRMLLDNPMALRKNCRRQITCATLVGAALLAATISCLRVDSSRAEDEATVEPIWRPVTYTQTMTIEGQQNPVVVKEYVAADGRKRSELYGIGSNVTISDRYGMPRIVLNSMGGLTKTAHVLKPQVAVDDDRQRDDGKDPNDAKNKRDLFVAPGQRWLESFTKIRNSPSERLGKKEIDGRIANGCVATQLGCNYTIWTDDATNDLVRVEYDTVVNGSQTHISMSDFHFGEKIDESLFSFEVPSDYKVFPAITTDSSGSHDDKTEAINAPTSMHMVWSNRGNWFLVAGTSSPPGLVSLNRHGQLAQFDTLGSKQSGFNVGGFFDSKALRIANLNGDGQHDFLTTEKMNSTVVAVNSDGKTLWTYSRGKNPGHDWSINDICAADLNGDGRDEVIIGFNGFTGLHVLNPDGALLWKETSFGNVWHVSAGNIQGDASPEVVCSAGDGKIHLFNGDGKPLRLLQADLYANMVRVWLPNGPISHFVGVNKTPDGRAKAFIGDNLPLGRIVVSGTFMNLADPQGGNKKELISSLDIKEKTHWSIDLPQRIVSAATCQQKPWLAVTLADGTAHVVDMTVGKEIASVGGQGGMTDVTWMPIENGDPLLVIATGDALNSFKIEAEKPK